MSAEVRNGGGGDDDDDVVSNDRTITMSLAGMLSLTPDSSADPNRSPKRQSSTVYEKVRAKLSRSLSSAASIAASASRGAQQPNDTEKVVLRKGSTPRRCQSEVTSPTTAQLLAQFVANRTSNGPVNNVASKGATPKSPDKVQPIVSVDKETGIIAVNKKWTCTKCSYAYNPIDATVCDVCLATGASGTEHKLEGDFQLVTTDLISSLEEENHTNGNLSPDDSWICSRCTLENPGPTSNCLACSGRRSVKGWICAKCTFKNTTESNRCKICEHPKRKPPANSNSNGIKCKRCTFENPPKNQKCEICDTKLDDQATKKSKDVLNNNSLKRPPKNVTEQQRPGSASSLGSRQESELMDQLREVEESEARDRWKNIVQFCKKVCYISLVSTCSVSAFSFFSIR